jgi:hypothetical protein
MLNSGALVGATVLLCWCCSAQPRQNPSSTGKRPVPSFDEFEKLQSEQGQTQHPFYGPPICGREGNEAVTKACLSTLTEYYVAEGENLRFRHASYLWALISSMILFLTTVLLIGMGLMFAWIQFRQSFAPSPLRTFTASDMSQQEVSVKPEVAVAPAHLGGLVEISSKRLTVSSPVLGVIVLAMSMAFLYMYLRYVYPIQEVRTMVSAPAKSE